MSYYPTLIDHGLYCAFPNNPKVIEKQSQALDDESTKQDLLKQIQDNKVGFLHLYKLEQETSEEIKFVKDRTVVFDKDFIKVWAALHRAFE